VSRRGRIIGLTIAAWTVVTALHAYITATRAIDSPTAIGYERELKFQLAFWCFPWLILFVGALLVIVFCEWQILSPRDEA
jgi:hypothetical protein